MKLYTKKLLALTFVLAVFVGKSQVTYTWTGGGTAAFSDPASWNPGSGPPTSADNIVFDGSSVINCDLDQVTNDVDNMTITAGYTGIISNASGNDLNVLSAYSQAGGTVDLGTGNHLFSGSSTFSGGTFDAAASTLDFNGDVTISGGTFIASSNVVSISNQVNSTAITLNKTSGVFTHNGGVVNLAVPNGGTVSVVGSFTFNELEVNVQLSGSVIRVVDFSSSSTTSTLSLKPLNRPFAYKGNIAIDDVLNIAGTNTSTLSASNTGTFTFNGASASIVSTTGVGASKLANIVVNTSGAMSMSGNIAVGRQWTSTNVGSFTPGSSTVTFFGAFAGVTSGTTAANTAYFDNVTIAATSTLNVTNNSFLDLNGNLTHTGVFNGNTSLFSFTGSGAHTVGGTATLTTLNAIEKSGSGSLTFGHATNLLDSIRITGGSVTGTNLTLKSTSSLKARVAEISGGGSLGGTITVETFIPGGTTDWAVLGASGVSGLDFNDWYGAIPMAIEGSATGVTSAGGYFESVWRWDETDAFGYDSTVTVTDPINVGQGYWLFVGTGLSSTSNITTTVTGTPVTGSQPIGLSNSAQGGSCLIANPFPSPISWDRIDAANAGVTTGEIHIYNADLGLTTSYVGGVSTPGGVGSATSTIPMGQGFYVVANGAGPLNIDEDAKVSNNTGSDPLLKSSAISSIGSVVHLNLTGGGYTDGTAIRFHSNGTTGFDNGLDARKYFDSPGYVGYPGTYTKRTTISTKGPTGFDYAINSLPYALTSPAVIPVLVKVYASGQHTISASGTSNLAPGTCVVLKDKLLNVTQDLKAGDYVFSINDTTATARFELTICANITAGVNNNTPVKENVLVSQDANGVYVDLKFENNTKAYITANNILGQQLMSPKQVECVSGKYYLDLNAKEQIIMVNVITNEKRTTKKVFVQNQN